MKFLLDTHFLLWAMTNSAQLSTEPRRLIEDKQNELYFSAISIWEVSVKFALKRRGFSINPRVLHATLVGAGYMELSFNSSYAQAVLSLPGIHKDPADRILVAQAMTEGITLLTADATAALYPGPIRMV